jgi:pimeloyl-ACP methyl ester carboxylesterase
VNIRQAFFRFWSIALSILVAATMAGLAHAQTTSGSAVGRPAVGELTVHPAPRAKMARAAPATVPVAVEPTPAAPRARVYLFRGALGPIFSTGMDRLAEKIVKAGLPADTYEFTLCPLIARAAITKYREDPAPIVLIGHSMGGRCALQFSERLQEEGIPVSLVVTIDPAHMSPEVPANVERFINIFLSRNVLGGGDIKPVAGFPGHYASYDLEQHDEVSHITIDKMDAVHQQLVAKILQLSATPAKTEGEILPLRYAVPPKADIELWDSGTAVGARAGDTLQSLALQYHLPLWSLAQANPGPADSPLIPGERITVPRHLAPVAGIAAPMTSAR